MSKIFRSSIQHQQLGLKRKCFNAWLLFTVDLKISTGKLIGILQLKRQYSIFSNWHILAKKRSAKTLQKILCLEQQKFSSAESFRINSLLKSCISAWRFQARQTRYEKQLESRKLKNSNQINSVLTSLMKPKIHKKTEVIQNIDKNELKLNLGTISISTEQNNRDKTLPRKTNSYILAQQRKIINEQRNIIQRMKTNPEIETTLIQNKRPISAPVLAPPKKFLEMQKRAEERKKRLDELKDARKKRQMEQEKEKERKIKEEEKIEEEKRKDEARQKKMKILMEKQRIQKRQEEIKIYNENLKIALAFYEKLLKKRTIKCLQTVVMKSNNFEKLAIESFQRRLLQKSIFAWKNELNNVQEVIFQKYLLYHDNYLLQTCLSKWKNVQERNELMIKQAEKHYNRNLSHKVLLVWADFNENVQKENFRKLKRAESHYRYYLIKHSFLAWKRWKQNEEELVLKEKRMQQLCSRVTEILPDFTF